MEKELGLHREKVRHATNCAIVAVAALESATRLSLCPRTAVLLQLVHVSALEAEISSMTLKLQWSEDDKTRLLRETEEQSNKVTSQTGVKIPLQGSFML